ncbi:MAG: hypothetical protein WBL80_08405 [Erysipelotrichaceae bacterium]
MHFDDKTRKVLTLILMPLAALFLFGLAFIGAALFSALFPQGRHIIDWHYLYIAILCIGYGLFLKLKVPVELKATLLSVPVVAILVKIGIATYTNAILTYVLAAIFIALLLGYLYIRKKHWLYIYAVVFTSVIVLLNFITGSEI